MEICAIQYHCVFDEHDRRRKTLRRRKQTQRAADDVWENAEKAFFKSNKHRALLYRWLQSSIYIYIYNILYIYSSRRLYSIIVWYVTRRRRCFPPSLYTRALTETKERDGCDMYDIYEEKHVLQKYQLPCFRKQAQPIPSYSPFTTTMAHDLLFL